MAFKKMSGIVKKDSSFKKFGPTHALQFLFGIFRREFSLKGKSTKAFLALCFFVPFIILVAINNKLGEPSHLSRSAKFERKSTGNTITFLHDLKSVIPNCISVVQNDNFGPRPSDSIVLSSITATLADNRNNPPALTSEERDRGYRHGHKSARALEQRIMELTSIFSQKQVNGKVDPEWRKTMNLALFRCITKQWESTR